MHKQDTKHDDLVLVTGLDGSVLDMELAYLKSATGEQGARQDLKVSKLLSEGNSGALGDMAVNYAILHTCLALEDYGSWRRNFFCFPDYVQAMAHREVFIARADMTVSGGDTSSTFDPRIVLTKDYVRDDAFYEYFIWLYDGPPAGAVAMEDHGSWRRHFFCFPTLTEALAHRTMFLAQSGFSESGTTSSTWSGWTRAHDTYVKASTDDYYVWLYSG